MGDVWYSTDAKGQGDAHYHTRRGCPQLGRILPKNLARLSRESAEGSKMPKCSYC